MWIMCISYHIFTFPCLNAMMVLCRFFVSRSSGHKMHGQWQGLEVICSSMSCSHWCPKCYDWKGPGKCKVSETFHRPWHLRFFTWNDTWNFQARWATFIADKPASKWVPNTAVKMNSKLTKSAVVVGSHYNAYYLALAAGHGVWVNLRAGLH